MEKYILYLYITAVYPHWHLSVLCNRRLWTRYLPLSQNSALVVLHGFCQLFFVHLIYCFPWIVFFMTPDCLFRFKFCSHERENANCEQQVSSLREKIKIKCTNNWKQVEETWTKSTDVVKGKIKVNTASFKGESFFWLTPWLKPNIYLVHTFLSSIYIGGELFFQ